MNCQGQRTYQLLWFSKSHDVRAWPDPEANKLRDMSFLISISNISDHKVKKANPTVQNPESK